MLHPYKHIATYALRSLAKWTAIDIRFGIIAVLSLFLFVGLALKGAELVRKSPEMGVAALWGFVIVIGTAAFYRGIQRSHGHTNALLACVASTSVLGALAGLA